MTTEEDQLEAAAFGRAILTKQSNKNFDPQNCEALIHIEAEDFLTSIATERGICSDFGGGYNLTKLHTGSSSSYQTIIPYAGIYRLCFRAASATTGGRITVFLNDRPLIQQEITSTGGWQNWTVFCTSTLLPKGLYDLRLEFSGLGKELFNLNWIELELLESEHKLIRQNSEILELSSFAEGCLINFPSTNDYPMQVKIADTNGKLVWQQDFLQETGTVWMEYRIMHLKTGVYNILLSNNASKSWERMIIVN